MIEEANVFPTKILLGMDGSEEARGAARLAMTLAENLDSELHLVHVEPVPSIYAYPEVVAHNPDILVEVDETAERASREKLAAEVEAVGGMDKVAGAHVATGRPEAEIVRVAEEIGAGLVIVGSRGLGPIRRAVMGGVSDSVVRHAHCPVLVVRGTHREGVDLSGPIVLAVDGSEESKLATRAATELSTATGARIHVMYVMPSAEQLYGRHLYSEDMRESLVEGARKEGRRFLDGRSEDIQSGGGSVAQTYLGTGRPDEEILDLAEKIDAALVVTGSRGLGGVRRALMGSVSNSLVRHAHCPVLVVRNPERDDSSPTRTAEEMRRA